MKYMTSKLQYLWAKKGAVHVMDRNNDFFLVRFKNEGDYKHALFEGPWLVLDHYLLVQRWRPFFRHTNSSVQKIATWVRIPDLPCELCNDKFLWRVGALIGTMLKVDRNTSIQPRGNFTRICVELDLRRELVPSFTVLGVEFNFEYEGLHLICFGCGKYGHKLEVCPDTIKPPNSDDHGSAGSTSGTLNKEREYAPNDSHVPDAMITDKPILGNSNEDSNLLMENSVFGPWMLVRKISRRRGNVARNQGDDLETWLHLNKLPVPDLLPKTGGSRFNALAVSNVHGIQGREDVAFSDGPHLVSISPKPGSSSRAATHLKQRSKGPQNCKPVATSVSTDP